MERIILTEFNPTRGHSVLLANTCRLLSVKYDVTPVVTQDNTRLGTNNCVQLPFCYYKSKRNPFIDFVSFVLYTIKIISAIFKVANRKGIDTIVCITYDEVSLFLLTPFISRKFNIYLMSHVNIDNYEKSRIKRWMFNKFKNRYSHIVQCGFLAEHLKKDYQLNNILVWPHPLNNLACSDTVRNVDCAGLSFSNDEEIIKSFMEAEIKNSVFKNHNLRVILKSQIYNYDDGYLTIIKGALSNKDYDDIINRAKSILMPFPLSFQYRMSGTLIDSLTNNKIVYSTPIRIIEESRKAYPNVIRVFNKESFISDLCSNMGGESNERDFVNFLGFHCDENLSKIMCDGLKASMCGDLVINQYDF